MNQVLGIDVHKQTLSYAVVTNTGDVIEGPREIPATPEALTRLGETHPTTPFVVEACGLQEWMLDHLEDHGIDALACVPPKKARKGPKNDKRDAQRIARLFLAGELSEVYLPPREERALRDLVRHHDFLTRKRTSFKNRLTHELNRYNQDTDGHGTYTPAAREHVEPEHDHLGDYYDLIWDLDARLKKLYRRIDKEADGHERARLVRSIPGWGAKTSLAFAVETGPVDRFDHAEQVTSYYGLDPVRSGSGQAEWDEHRISKQGKAYVRGLLVEAAWGHVRHCPESSMSQWFSRRTENGLARMKGIVGVARRLTEAAYALLRDQREFMLTGPAPSVPCRPNA